VKWKSERRMKRRNTKKQRGRGRAGKEEDEDPEGYSE
jgi:hypothetical protein